MSAPISERLSERDYLTRERQAETKSEYLARHAFALARSSHQHSLIKGNILATLYGQLRGRPSEVYASDLRVKADLYRKIGTFGEYLLVAQDRVFLEHHVRRPDGSWLMQETASLDAVIQLESVACRLAVKDMYERVEVA